MLSERRRTYQTCNEFGYFQTSTSPNQPFVPLTLLDLQSYLDVGAGWGSVEALGVLLGRQSGVRC